MSRVILVSNDGKPFPVEVKVATKFHILKKRYGLGGDPEIGRAYEDKRIRIGNVNGAVLRRVIQWVDHHKNDGPFVPIEYNEGAGLGQDVWEGDFFRENFAFAHDIYQAAIELGIPALKHITKFVIKLLEELEKTGRYAEEA